MTGEGLDAGAGMGTDIREGLGAAIAIGRLGVVAALARIGEGKLRDFYNGADQLTPDELLSLEEVL